MNLASTIELTAGGAGSGCHGDNCGRPSKANWEVPSGFKSLIERGHAEVKTVKVSEILPYEQKRTKESREKIERLRESLRTGKAVPMISVHRYSGGGHPIEDGHHRLVAAKKEGLKEIPVVVLRTL